MEYSYWKIQLPDGIVTPITRAYIERRLRHQGSTFTDRGEPIDRLLADAERNIEQADRAWDKPTTSVVHHGEFILYAVSSPRGTAEDVLSAAVKARANA